jgi:hypothetical protein
VGLQPLLERAEGGAVPALADAEEREQENEQRPGDAVAETPVRAAVGNSRWA